MSILSQKTVKAQVTFEGIGLHTGINSKITIKPSSPNSGIIFIIKRFKVLFVIESELTNLTTFV